LTPPGPSQPNKKHKRWGKRIDHQTKSTVGTTAKEDTAAKEDAAVKEGTTAEENPKKNVADKKKAAWKKNGVAKKNTGSSDDRTLKESSGLDLSSKIDIVTQILEKSSRNSPALPQADSQKAEDKSNEPSQKEKETLGHIAKHVQTKERGQLSSKDLGLIREYRFHAVT
jgi:hypothetical protein